MANKGGMNAPFQRVAKPSHSPAVLRAGAHECDIRSRQYSSFLGLQRFSITLKRRERAKIKFILALSLLRVVFFAFL